MSSNRPSGGAKPVASEMACSGLWIRDRRFESFRPSQRIRIRMDQCSYQNSGKCRREGCQPLYQLAPTAGSCSLARWISRTDYELRKGAVVRRTYHDCWSAGSSFDAALLRVHGPEHLSRTSLPGYLVMGHQRRPLAGSSRIRGGRVKRRSVQKRASMGVTG